MAIRIKELRLQHKYSCKQLGDILKISESAYRYFESNTMQSHNLKRLLILSKFYGITIDYILGISDKPHE